MCFKNYWIDISFFIISVIFKAHTWISCSDNETSYLCFIVKHLLNMFYRWKILVFFALSNGYIYFCLNTYFHLLWIMFEVGCLFLRWLYIYIWGAMAGIIQKSCVALFPLWSHKKNSKFKFDKKSCCYDNCNVIEIWM